MSTTLPAKPYVKVTTSETAALHQKFGQSAALKNARSGGVGAGYVPACLSVPCDFPVVASQARPCKLLSVGMVDSVDLGSMLVKHRVRNSDLIIAGQLLENGPLLYIRTLLKR